MRLPKAGQIGHGGEAAGSGPLSESARGTHENISLSDLNNEGTSKYGRKLTLVTWSNGRTAGSNAATPFRHSAIYEVGWASAAVQLRVSSSS